MGQIVKGIWNPPPVNLDQWEVSLGLLRLTVNAKSHQDAKETALPYWASCSGDDPAKSLAVYRQRVAERWRGGIKVRLCHRGADFK